MNAETYSLKQACELLGVTRYWIMRFILTGKVVA